MADTKTNGEFYGVTVYDRDGAIVTIEPFMLTGRDIGAREEAAIRSAVRQLSGFIGLPTAPTAGDLIVTAAVPLLAAAPELLAALKEIADDLEARWDMRDRSTNPGIRHCVEQARAAIAKAEGR